MVKKDDKRLINNETVDVNQLVPIKYDWAWKAYNTENANHWLPQEIPMTQDIVQWNDPDALSEKERHVILRTLGFFSTAESLVANNIALGIFRHVTAAECRQYLLRQAYTEAIHTEMFMYICESLGLDEEEIFSAYETIPTIAAKDELEMEFTEAISNPLFTTKDDSDAQTFLANLVGFYVVLEGIFFYGGFAMILAMYRQNKMRGIGEQFSYVLRDESVHLQFGVDLINGIKQENPHLWTEEFKTSIRENILRAVELEKEYAIDCVGEGFLGFTAKQFSKYVEYIADRRLVRIGLEKEFGSRNPFPWMSETMDLPKERNFFEGRVTEYQKAATLKWD